MAVVTGAGILSAGVLPDWTIRTGRSRTVLFASMLSTALTLIVILFGHPFLLLTGMLALTGLLVLADLPIVLSVTELHVPPAEVGTPTGLLCRTCRVLSGMIAVRNLWSGDLRFMKREANRGDGIRCIIS